MEADSASFLSAFANRRRSSSSWLGDNSARGLERSGMKKSTSGSGSYDYFELRTLTAAELSGLVEVLLLDHQAGAHLFVRKLLNLFQQQAHCFRVNLFSLLLHYHRRERSYGRRFKDCP